MGIKTSAFMATSLDGFIARADHGLDWLEHDAGSEDYGFKAFMDSVDTMVMGRNTFDIVRNFDGWHYGDTPVVVASQSFSAEDVPTKLRDTVSVSDLSPRDLLAQLEAKGMGHVYVDGGKLVQSYLREGLLTELTVARLPILLGSGIPLFGELPQDVALEHLGTTSYETGLVQSRYRVVQA